jgi:hypothetical protein
MPEASGNPTGVSADDLDAAIEHALRGDGTYTFGGNALHGWWTGRTPSTEQFLAAPYGDELFLARFDDTGSLSAVERHPYPADGRADPLPSDCINVADLEARLRALLPGFTAGMIRVRPFEIEEIEFALHALPDWARFAAEDRGTRAREMCRRPWEWEALCEWFERGCCEVYFHSDGCWYSGSGEPDN